MILNSAAKVYFATKNEKFGEFLVKGIDKCCDCGIEEGFAGNDNDLTNLLLANVLYAAKDYTGKDEYEKAAIKMAAQLNSQKRSEKDILRMLTEKHVFARHMQVRYSI